MKRKTRSGKKIEEKMTMMSDEEFEKFLGEGMRARATPAGAGDLARRAILLRRGNAAGAAGGQVRMWSNMLASAASLLIVALLAVGGYWAVKQNSETAASVAEATDSTVSESAASADATGSNSNSSSSGWNWSTVMAGGVVLVAAGALWGSRGPVVVGTPARG